MRQAILIAGFAALAAATPAPQNIDFAAVNAAPTPTLSGPSADVTSQSVVVNAASVSASGSAAVTGVVTASATASSNAKAKRWFWGNWSQPSSSSNNDGWGSGSDGWGVTSTTSTVKATSTSVAPTTSKAATTSSTVSSSTASATPYVDQSPCVTQPDGYGPKVQPDTPAAFEAYAEFATEANNAVTPSGYTQTFKNLNASVNGATYLGLTTYTSYDVAKCASQCDSTSLCTGINIYVERDPSIDPAANCSNPASITNYKCTLWGSSVDASLATNYGQYREDFQVVIAGSNAYTKTVAPPTQPGWNAPQSCGGGNKGHSHPSTCLGQHFFPGPYNPAYCSAFAISQNAKNAPKIPSWFSWLYSWMNYSPYKCTFFNSYMLKKNGKPMGTYCSLFAQSYSSSQATYNPGQQGSDSWSIESSWTYSIQ